MTPMALRKLELPEFLDLYFLKRVVYSILILWAVATIIFVMTNVIPGSAAHTLLGQTATEERVAQMEAELGLDEPVHERYVDWLTGVVTGDWGNSFFFKEPVTTVIWPKLIHTFQLAMISISLLIVLGIPLGVITAWKRGGWLDTTVSSLSYIGISMPEFVTGTLLILLFATGPLKMFPTGGYEPLRAGVVPWLTHLALPAITLTVLILAHIMRQTRSSTIEELHSEYVRTARLKGLGEWKVLFKHVLRNGLLPAITVIAMNFGWMMGSLVVVEEVFTYPGLGRLIVQSIHNQDLPLMQMAILIPASTYVVANLVADLMYSYLDARIEFGGR